MNRFIAALVGALAAFAALVSGVHVAQGHQTPVASDQLRTYAQK
ncbi:hypothetical protein GCM10028801_20380 [Nocardioides maradonensis]